MKKTLQKTGNSYALIIDRSLMESARIEPDTPLEVTTDGEVIVIAPQRGKARKERFQRAKQKVIERYKGVLKRLA